ncbi:MAG: transposase [Cyanobacteria bacterium P01_D01_bin.115]
MCAYVHGVIVITDIDRRDMALPCPAPVKPRTQKRQFSQPVAGSLGTIVGSYKSAVAKHINLQRQAPKMLVWQRNYYEHIICNERAVTDIRQYIHNNPTSWQTDQFHPDCPPKW